MKGAEPFVRCLGEEGVRHVFGVPGEETLDPRGVRRAAFERGGVVPAGRPIDHGRKRGPSVARNGEIAALLKE